MTATSLACFNKTVEDNEDEDYYDYEDNEDNDQLEEMQQCRDRIESLLRYVLSILLNLFEIIYKLCCYELWISNYLDYLLNSEFFI